MAQLIFSLPKLFEATMLICFGASWPFSIRKVLRTKRTEGKSPTFIFLILIGYVSGILWKLVTAVQAERSPEPITLLYALNGLLVAVDLVLYAKYRLPETAGG